MSRFDNFRIWLMSILCPKHKSVFVSGKYLVLNKTIHVWGRQPVIFYKTKINGAGVALHISGVSSGFKAYVKKERQ